MALGHDCDGGIDIPEKRARDERSKELRRRILLNREGMYGKLARSSEPC